MTRSLGWLAPTREALESSPRSSFHGLSCQWEHHVFCPVPLAPITFKVMFVGHGQVHTVQLVGGNTPYMPKHATGPRAATGGMLIRGAQSPESILSRSYLLLSHVTNDVILGVFSGDVMLCYPEGHHVRYANAHLQTPCCTDSQHE
jgi:hypothetical protein